MYKPCLENCSLSTNQTSVFQGISNLAFSVGFLCLQPGNNGPCYYAEIGHTDCIPEIRFQRLSILQSAVSEIIFMMKAQGFKGKEAEQLILNKLKESEDYIYTLTG